MVYENIEAPGYGPSHRTVTEITGLVIEVRQSEFLVEAKSIKLNRYRRDNGKWISDISLYLSGS